MLHEMTKTTNTSPVPVNIICGALGAGKTTAIAKLLSNKPAEESWIVILNEFTDTGMDALTLAATARGNFDVRMIPGGCLCCTGEEDFRRQLTTLLSYERLPSRILIEPSGIGHPGSVIQELQLFERSGAIKLMSSIAMVEPSLMQAVDSLSGVVRDQIESADVVLMSKSELANELLHNKFETWARGLFPAKRFVGFSQRGAIPNEALAPDAAFSKFSIHQNTHHDHQHSHQAEMNSREISISSHTAIARAHHYLNRHGCGWLIPDAVMFDLAAIEVAMKDKMRFINAERFKAALRTNIDRWHLVQRWNDQYEIREIAWRTDSRMEIQMKEGVDVDWGQWDQWLTSVVES